MRVIAGPCLMESLAHCWHMAVALAGIRDRLKIPYFIFKASVMKMNRTSGQSPRQMVISEQALELFERIQMGLGMPCITDVHEVPDSIYWGTSVLQQVPALLSRQTDLIEAAAVSGTVHIKKGQFMAPHDVHWAVKKARDKNPNCYVMVSERGYSFGYNNLVVDMRSFPIMKVTSGADEVLFDCTHSVQLPSADSGRSSGNRAFIEPLARAAIVSGADGLFCEVHDDPSQALSDGPCQIPLNQFEDFLKRMLDLYEWQRQNPVSDLSVR